MFSPLVCFITLANSPSAICFVRQKNPFSRVSALSRHVSRLTPPHAWKPTRQGRSRALERSCALFSRGDARDVRELGARYLHAGYSLLQEKPPYSYQTHQGDPGQKAPQISVPGVLAVDRGARTRRTRIAATKQPNQLRTSIAPPCDSSATYQRAQCDYEPNASSSAQQTQPRCSSNQPRSS